MTVDVSAIMCTRNRPDQIGQAVKSVLANTYPKFDLTVIDQSTDDQTGQVVRALAEQHPNLRYVHSTTPGLSRAYNTGIRESNGTILAFTDDDCVAPSDWISVIVDAFERNPDGELLYGQVERAKALVGVDGECPELKFTKAEKLGAQHGFRIYGMGANFAARRTIFQRVGGFDEILGGGGPLKSSQDYDFQYRVYRAGATVLLEPRSTVEHYGLRTWAQWPATLRAYGFGDGAFYSKHIRCGDLFALSLLVRQLARFSAREVLSRIGLRRRPSRAEYVTQCLAGIWAGLRYPVDRRRRMYGALALN
jgi:glycosyltransferase involved in cell wall biosynthesis